MNWDYEFTDAAEKDFQKLPRHIQKRVSSALDVARLNPFHGDIKALTGPDWPGAFRRRIGKYRMIFGLKHSESKILIIRILIRSKGTYR